jgi:hypothetical protein
MKEKTWNTRYEQLNGRVRWYASQLWYIPFAYVGLLGIGINNISKLSYPLANIGYALLGLFSLAVFVHISSLKYYERRAVRSLQRMEKEIEHDPESGGASKWYISFAFYIKAMILAATYSLVGYATLTLKTIPQIIFFMAFLILTIIFVVVISIDSIRNQNLRAEVAENTK